MLRQIAQDQFTGVLVSNCLDSGWMARKNQFRVLLPLAQCPLAAFFGGLGLWQRAAILSRPGFGEGSTLWDTTARYHVWPWPFKFAVVTNTPAFLTWALVGWQPIWMTTLGTTTWFKMASRSVA
jgi:hypothetical protein